MDKPTAAAMRAAQDLLPGMKPRDDAKIIATAEIIDAATLLPEVVAVLRGLTGTAGMDSLSFAQWKAKARDLLSRLEK